MIINNINYRIFLVVFVSISILFSCEKDENDTPPENEYIIESELLLDYSSSDILDMIESSEAFPPDFEFIAGNLVQNDIRVYKIVYETTDTNNDPVLASGALVVPVNSTAFPLMSFQHGTLFTDQEAPSYFTGDDYTAAVVYASAGYIIALPDFLGYGSSGHIDHPYEHGKTLATASLDMLRAVREFDLTNNDFQADDRLFLTGYSEGGYATMALLKYIEEEHPDEFRVTAATAGAGAYNKTAFAKEIMNTDANLKYLNSFLWVLDTYNSVYDLDRPYSYYFNEPYAEVIDNEGVFANNETNPANLFTSSFREGILQGTDIDFLDVLDDNDNYNWKPDTPLTLYHGTDDDYVYYLNSSTAFEAMTENGAGSVTLVPIAGGDHFDSIYDYFSGTLLFFRKF